jgi:DNA-binding PucR family transcriptional regulator
VEFEEAGLFARVMESPDAERLVRDITASLRSLDKLSPRQREESKRTLLTFFDCRHNLTRTAEELGLHINTVRQRLNRLREVAGNWDDPVKTLELHFALRLDAVMRAPASFPESSANEQGLPARRTNDGRRSASGRRMRS